MTTFSQVYAALRRKNKGQYVLLAGCSFFSVLLITAYACMMRAPTILSVLPEGGDSRKQVMMVFVLAVLGCAVFTAYAAGLFFRQKSRETGVFLALGATRRQLHAELGKELALISLCSCAAGAILGGPLAWGIWQLFRLFLVDSQEMALTFDPEAYLLSLAFAVYVVAMLFLMGNRAVRRTNIIDIVQESHTSEPIREVKRWYGPVGIVLVAVGALAGYLMPSFFIRVLRWYPPTVVDAVFYLPALVGMYMMLLHTVVNGWRKRHKYRDIIATSMMKFQGRQTVRNMLVMTLLIAGAYFAAFYSPMLSANSAYSFASRPVDFEYHWRNDQDLPEQAEVETLAEEYGVDITSWQQVGGATLGGDGTVSVEQDNGALGTTYTTEYREVASGATFFSESAWNALTGQTIDLAPGTCANVLDDEGGSEFRSGGDVTLVTNMVTGESLPVTPGEPLRYTMLLGSYVLDDDDYAAITDGLTDLWRESWVFFNVADAEYSYPFAKALFNEIVDRSSDEVMQLDAYDLVAKTLAEEAGEAYLFDRENLTALGFPAMEREDRDSTEFRSYWLYMPQFRVLDQNDFVTTMAVFLMLFIFIALICFAAVIVIAFTRCMTIALTNRRVYDDLRHLGAPNAYLFRSVKGQVSRVFLVPAIVGTAIISAFYVMIMYFNDSRFTPGEIAGMGTCAAVIVLLSLVLYGVYQFTRKSVCRSLGI
ncbi:FtsX-like permease family protein [Pseudoflavonifractor phocaeensis]|uniref:FtsX-like permease family protein n=1 Tax=Pseudoflavonifractor phocaeensis TaxID=1870988 RepID=UPI00195A23E1|nr:ABC transporter permease [Pseudoflavonifractor phocaeensis]MBM6926701.1 ABC transporter permease [Pseudoflavonifractor phocaeensis]